jgi:hypothetical protein
MTDPDDERGLLLHDLELINRAFDRKGVQVLVTVDEAETLPVDNLRSVVAGSGDHLTHVLRQLSGL